MGQGNLVEASAAPDLSFFENPKKGLFTRFVLGACKMVHMGDIAFAWFFRALSAAVLRCGAQLAFRSELGRDLWRRVGQGARSRLFKTSNYVIVMP